MFGSDKTIETQDDEGKKMIELQRIIFLQLRMVKEQQIFKYNRIDFNQDKIKKEGNFFGFLDFNPLNSLSARNFYKHDELSKGKQILSKLNFSQVINQHMQGGKTTSPVMIGNLNFGDSWGKNLLVLSNFLPNNGSEEKVSLLEVGQFVTHNAGFAWNRTEEGIKVHKLYNENTVTKKAIIDLETFQRANLGQFGVRSLNGNSNVNTEYSMEKIYYYNDTGLVSLQMSDMAVPEEDLPEIVETESHILMTMD